MPETILRKLEETRDLMIQSGMENGLQNRKTILLSKKLDELLNLYNEKKFQKPNPIVYCGKRKFYI